MRMAEITDTWYLREHLPSIHSDDEASIKPKLHKISMQARRKNFSGQTKRMVNIGLWVNTYANYYFVFKNE